MTSNGEYWKEREEAWEKEYAKRGAYWNAQINEIYKNLQEDMQAEIDGWYARYAQAEGFTMAHAMQAISKADQDYYARRAEYLVRLAQEDMQSGGNTNSKIYFSKIANAEMRLYNSTMKISRMQAIQSMLDLQIAKASKEVNATMEKALTERANAALKNAQILGPTVIDNTKRIAELVNSSFHGATYSERIWNTHAPSLAKTVQSSLSRMLVLGQTPLEARKQLMKDSKLSTKAAGRAAERLLRTEGARIQTQAMLSVIKEAGFDQFEFIANGGCCPECQLLDGKKMPVANAAYAESLPPLHPNCRCSIAPYSDRKEYEAWLDSYTEHGLDFGEWKEAPDTVKEFYRGFHALTEQEGERKLLQIYSGWKNSLTNDEYKSIDKYTYNEGDEDPDKFYQVVNRTLRGVNYPNDRDLLSHIQSIRTGLDKSTLPSGLICYRGQDVDILKQYNVGDKFLLKGFTSTSLNAKGAFDRKVKIIFKVKDGKGAYLQPISRFKKQKEILLQDYSKAVLLSKKGNEYVVGVIR